MLDQSSKKLAKILKMIIEEEKTLDNYRGILYEIESFSPLILFYELDRQKKNFITEIDLYNLLKSYDDNISSKYLRIIISIYDVDKDGKLSFEDFLHMITPNRSQYKSTMSNRKEVSELIKYSLYRIIQAEISSLIKIEHLIKEINNLDKLENITNLYKHIELGNNHISEKNLYDYMFRHGYIINSFGIKLLFKKLDFSKDEKIDFNDLKFLFFIFEEENFIEQNKKIEIDYLNYLEEKCFNDNDSSNRHKSSNYLRYEKYGLYNLKENADLNQHDDLFVNFLNTITKNEKEIEQLKMKFIDLSDFKYTDLVIIFKNDDSDIITYESFKNALTLFGVYENISNIKLIFRRYGKLYKREYLTIEEFLNVLLPLDYTGRKILLNRNSSENLLIYDQKIFKFETRSNIKELFNKIINFEKIIQKQAEVFYNNKNFSLKEIFDKISIEKRSYLTIEDFNRYLIINRVNHLDDDLNLLFRKFDQNQDGKVTYSEFSNGLLPLI